MQTVKCTSCGLVNWGSAESCKRCQTVFTQAEPVGAMPSEPYGAEQQVHAFEAPTEAPVPVIATRPTYERQTYRPEPLPYNQQSSQGQKRGLAIFSMIAGILAMPPISLFGLAIVIGLLVAAFGSAGLVISGIIALALFPMGLITGVVSLVRANKKPFEFGGKGFAIAGISLSSFALVTVPVVAAIAIPNLLAARRAANEGSAIAVLRKIRDMQVDYIAENGKCGDIDMLTWDKDPNNPTLNVKNGYHFVIAHSPVTGCEITAKPTLTKGVSATGTRTFSMSSEEDWEIMASTEGGPSRSIDGQDESRPQRADTRGPARSDQ